MVVYIDDIIIYSETWEDHVQYIDRVLSKCTPINLKISLKKCNFGQQELLALGHKVSGLSLEIDQNKVAAVHQKPVPKSIKEMQSFLGFASYYKNHIKNFAHITSSLYKLCSKDVIFEITKERRDAYERIKHELTNAPVLILPDFELPFKLYINAACSQRLGAALHQRQIVDGEPGEVVICYISMQLKDSEARYEATQTECLCLVCALEELHYYLEGAVFEVYTDFTALKSLLNMKTTNRYMLRWQIAIQDSSELHNEFFSAVLKSYAKHKQCGILLQLLQQKYRRSDLESQLEEPWLKAYKDNKFFLIDGLFYHRERHTSALTVVERDHISLILQECHDCPYMGHMSEDRTKERVASTAWWPKWEQELG
ncbi:hypothetical protein O181_126486 [Austropuccinia psidii MF-1]|uniref:Reverse transcriptase domain-containing protein n=1 Tax=Austropuccinia psidii MF-1 TaxID=1389203 RepID=A0A9Q3KUD5_9BASI|nr:hypothetical protein [Austropuccinia psidii MF-1]